ncbi:MAG: alpha-1,2-fucosyltransferase, partial [Cyanobacteria bacterium J06573_2]
MSEDKYASKPETNKGFSVFKTFQKDAVKINFLSKDDTTIFSEPIISMSSLGDLGRFGNQLLQYAFLRVCAKKSNSRMECSPWIGQSLFGLEDAQISRRLPLAVEKSYYGPNLFDYIPEFIPYIEKLSHQNSFRIHGEEFIESGLTNVDLWGYFQVHTHYFQPYKEEIRSWFQPVSDLKSSLLDGLEILRSQGKTIVGVHIRRGDFFSVPMAGFTLVVPSKWWCNWLESIWDELENPVLFLCSDDLDNVIDDFKKFSPITYRDLDIQLPERFQDLDIGFYTDFFLLSNCDVVGISNSIFSFTACMLNERGTKFVRPTWNFSEKFAEFDPWNSVPLLHIGD